MFVMRTATQDDLNDITALAAQAGIGLTTLPHDKHRLQHNIQRSIDALNKAITSPNDEYYFFVLEDTDSGAIVGTSAIDAAVGKTAPFYSYKVATVTRVSHELNIKDEYRVLHIVNDLQGKTELCTLFLAKPYRRSGNGMLLARGRFLFMAEFKQRFSDLIFAEMRGISDPQGNSPFWQNIGEHFFHMPFSKADHLTATTNKQFIADLVPQHPIYVSLLKKKTQAIIGKAHRSTMPALNLLKKESFQFQDYIDIFDGGPTLTAPFDHIHSIQHSQCATVEPAETIKSPHHYLISNTQLNFRACCVPMDKINDKRVSLSHETMKVLHLKPGDKIRYIAR